jgi:hypothetical protein
VLLGVLCQSLECLTRWTQRVSVAKIGDGAKGEAHIKNMSNESNKASADFDHNPEGWSEFCAMHFRRIFCINPNVSPPRRRSIERLGVAVPDSSTLIPAGSPTRAIRPLPTLATRDTKGCNATVSGSRRESWLEGPLATLGYVGSRPIPVTGAAPLQTFKWLFKYLGRLHQNRVEELDAERLGRFDVDHKYERGRPLHGWIGRPVEYARRGYRLRSSE